MRPVMLGWLLCAALVAAGGCRRPANRPAVRPASADTSRAQSASGESAPRQRHCFVPIEVQRGSQSPTTAEIDVARPPDGVRQAINEIIDSLVQQRQPDSRQGSQPSNADPQVLGRFKIDWRKDSTAFQPELEDEITKMFTDAEFNVLFAVKLYREYRLVRGTAKDDFAFRLESRRNPEHQWETETGSATRSAAELKRAAVDAVLHDIDDIRQIAGVTAP